MSRPTRSRTCTACCSAMRGGTASGPKCKLSSGPKGAAFQVDMASELVAPFEFEDVAVPALVGYGTATVTEHSRGARWLVDRLPRARLRATPGAGHFAPRTHPEEFAAFMGAVIAMTGADSRDQLPRAAD